MKIIRNIRKMAGISREQKLKRRTIGFVPTMGALHEGHLSLIRQARGNNDFVAVSIFVNPAQFGPGEDFGKYPGSLKQDAKFCREEGVDIIFYPHAKMMYPPDFRTFVAVEGLSDVLCGRFRPGHFKGVATIVTKLFNIVQPSVAYFGQKDAQQAVIIKRLTADLNIPVEIKVMPTVRESSGLALSSRNKYLNERERQEAVVLSRSLDLAEGLINSGVKDAKVIIQKMRCLIRQKDSVRKIDYISIVDTDTLKPVKRISASCLIALAVWIGKTRLVDNALIR